MRALLIQKDVKLRRAYEQLYQEFESFVNSERCKTVALGEMQDFCLRALLIQKDVKQGYFSKNITVGLRALLIQKDVKH